MTTRIYRNLMRRSFSKFIDPTSIIYKNEHRNLQDSLLKIIEKDINPFVDEWEKAQIFPAKKVMKLLGEAGFLGADKPTEFGGQNLDFSYTTAIAEQLGAIRCGGVSMAVGVQMCMATPALADFGSDFLKQTFLAPSIAGDIVACLGVSEPSAGSDVAAIRTRARKDDDDLVIDGEKMWITNGIQADWMCLLCNTEHEENNDYKNKSLICLPMDSSGITVHKIEKMGMHSSDTAHVFLDSVRVPRSHVIGKAGSGFQYQMRQFQLERLFAVAVALMPLETLIIETMQFAADRGMYGRTLLHNQVVSFTLAELLTELECVRSLLYRAVHAYTVEGADVTALATMGKLKIGRLSRDITDRCLQFWGGTGYTPQTYVNRLYRDFRLLSIGGGADEVMLGILSKTMAQKLK